MNMREHDLASVLALAFVNFIAVSSSIVEKCDTQVFASETRHIYLLPPDSFYMLHLLKSNCKVQTSLRRKSCKEIYSFLFESLENCSLNISCLHLSVFAAEHFPNYTKHENRDEKSTGETGVWKQWRHCHFDLL